MEQEDAEVEVSTIFHKAAKASWVCGLLAVFVVGFLRSMGPALSDLFALVFIGVGFLAGLMALFGISQNGAKGILIPALIGLIITGGLGYIWITNFQEARRRATEARRQRDEQSYLISKSVSTQKS